MEAWYKHKYFRATITAAVDGNDRKDDFRLMKYVVKFEDGASAVVPRTKLRGVLQSELDLPAWSGAKRLPLGTTKVRKTIRISRHKPTSSCGAAAGHLVALSHGADTCTGKAPACSRGLYPACVWHQQWSSEQGQRVCIFLYRSGGGGSTSSSCLRVEEQEE